ncbi:MAG: GspH/FimT family pseudopilin [Burkholderiales bacterium]|nr:GspH/FimT family pseudopilin [Burkholderiales bacterium]
MKSWCGQFEARTPGHRGFTLTEILIVVAVIGILSALGAPAFSDLIKSQRIKSMATDVSASLTTARSEAVKRNKNVTISPVVADTWKSGWKIVDPDDASRSIEVHSAFDGLTATGPSSVTYRSSGRIQGNTAPEFDISASGSSDHRCVTVDLSGRPYTKAAAC